MNDERSDGFLGRWSRRKAQARTGQPLAEPDPVVAPDAAADAALESHLPAAPVDPAPAPAEPEAPALTMDDVNALTIDSDFRPFVARSVAPELRNAAFKKLFADPHFNVMDGLDIYIDDYTQPDPLPASMLRQMASAQFLKMFDDEEEQAAQAQVPGAALDEAAVPAEGAADAADAAPPLQPRPPEGGGDVAHSGLCPDLPMPPPEVAANHDQDPDLRLQPDDAAGRPADRPGAA